MSKTRIQRTLLATSFMLSVIAALPASAATPTTKPICIGILPPSPPPGSVTPPPAPLPPPDSTLYTSYWFNTGYTNVYWIVCGATQESDGCYGSGTLGPFGKAGAIIEGNPVVDATTNTVTRHIYFVDEAVGGGTGMTLYDYTKTDVVTQTSDTITITLTNSIPLPLTGGTGATTYMAADNAYLFIGTNQSGFAVKVQKVGLSTTTLGGFSPPVNVSSITSDQYGYVSVTFGGISGEDGFYVFDPNGNLDEDGGGADFVAGTQTGLSTANLVTITPSGASAQLAARMHFRLKKMAPQSAPGN